MGQIDEKEPKMAEILTEKNLGTEKVEEGDKVFNVETPVSVFCDLTVDKLLVYFPENLEIKDALPKINKYLAWLKDVDKVNNQMTKRNAQKITFGAIGLDKHEKPTAVFLSENDKGKKIRLELEGKSITNCGYET